MSTLADFPYIFNNTANDPLNKPDATKLMADLQHLRTFLNGGNLDGDNMFGSASPGELLIANSSGVVVATAMSGDVTMSSSGVTEIGAGKVTNETMGLTLPGVSQTAATIDIPDGTWVSLVTLTTPAAGTYLGFADIQWTWGGAGANTILGKFSTNADTDASQGMDTTVTAGHLAFSSSITLDGATNVTLQAEKGTAGGASDLKSQGDADAFRHLKGVTYMTLLPVGQ